jgi:hypothetical protein
MRHIRAIKKFAKSPLYVYRAALQAFAATGLNCSLQVYDRFISDRTFGTKKRILLLPGTQKLGTDDEYVRIGPSIARYMVDAIDEDMYAEDPHLTCYLLREAAYTVEIFAAVAATQRASGRKADVTLTLIDDQVRWGDYERYTASSNKQDMEEVSNTIMDIYLPLSAPVNTDHFLRIDGKTIAVKEVSRVSNLLWIRGTRQDIDVPPTTNQRAYACELTLDWTRQSAALDVTQLQPETRTFASAGMCDPYLLPVAFDYDSVGIRAHTGQGFVPYDVNYTGTRQTLRLYSEDHVLLATAVNGLLVFNGDPTIYRNLILASYPQVHMSAFTGELTVEGVTP